MGKGVQVYINTDENGEILSAQQGQYIVPSEMWDFYFYTSEEVATSLTEYKVVIEGIKPKLVRNEVKI